jgi:ABC-2 type transport system permease protein
MRAFRKVYLRELKRLLNHQSSRTLLLIIPLITFAFLGYIYKKGVLHDIPVAVIDLDKTELSRTLIHFIDASPSLKVSGVLNSEKEPDKLLQNGKVYAVYVFPKGFEKPVLKGKSQKLTVYVNGTNIIHGNIIYAATAKIAMTVTGGALIKQFMEKDISYEQAMNIVLPIKVHTKPLYNPVYNYQHYLVPGLMTVLFFMIVFFVSTRSVNLELAEGSWPDLIELAKGNPFLIFQAKAFAILTLSFSIILLIFGIFFPLFGIPVNGALLKVILWMVIATLPNIFLGLALSSIVSKETLAMDIAFFYNSPAFVFSGFTFPVFGMPLLNSTYAQILPYTHFLTGFIKLYQMDTSWQMVTGELQALLIFMILGMIASPIALYFRIKQLRKAGI